MSFRIHSPESLVGMALDIYLVSGWFRSGQQIYTVGILPLEGALYKPIRIRLALEGYEFRKSLRKIWKKNKGFKVVAQKATITAEKEALYQKYISRFEDISPSLLDALQEGESTTIYDTYEIALYDEDKLIAVSFFDLGKITMASIMGIFDPDYNSYSLGFYTMLLEIQFGKDNGFKYYYPGYVIPKYPKFDYKLRIGDVEFYHVHEDNWYPIKKALKKKDMFEHVIKNIDYYKGKYY